MKRTIAPILIFLIVFIMLIGCMADVAEVTVVLKNDTDLKLKWVVFNIPQSSGAYSPMNNIVTAKDDALMPGEEREVIISFVESDFGNSGGALIGLQDDGSSDFLVVAQGEVILKRGINRFKITNNGETFVIMTDDG